LVVDDDVKDDEENDDDNDDEEMEAALTVLTRASNPEISFPGSAELNSVMHEKQQCVRDVA
jgi:hypothetical protein